MPYPFDQIFAADPDNTEMVASNVGVLIFAPGDETKTPLQLTTLTGIPLANPVPVNDKGFGSAFMCDLDQVAWEGGGYTGLFASYRGMKDEAVAARQAAEGARAAAEEAARNSTAPTTEAIATALGTAGPARDAVNAAVIERTTELALKPDNGARAIGKGELVTNVRDYGAKGDGGDELAAIQAAIDATPMGGTLIFPGDFTYDLGAGALEVNRAIRLEGGRFRTSSGRALLITSSGAEVRGVEIVGPGTTVPYVNRNPGIEVRGTSTNYLSVKILECRIRGMRDTGIAAEYIKDFDISGNTIENFRYGGIMLNSAKSGTVSHNTIREAVQDTVGLSYGIAISDLENTAGARSEDITVSFNHVEGIREWEGLDTHGGKNITFASNTVKECRNGIVLTVGSNTRTTAPEGCRVIGNHITAPILSQQRTTTGVALGGSAPSNPLHPLLTDAVVVGNNMPGTTIPISLPASTGPAVDRVKSVIANNSGDTPPVTDETDTGWQAITDYGALQPGYASNSTYPARIRVIKNRQTTRVLFEGVISIVAATPPTTNVFFIMNESTGLRPTFDRMVGTSQTVSGTIQRYQLSINAGGAYRTIFPSTPSTANFTIAGEYAL